MPTTESLNEWPKRIKVYVHGSKEYMWDKGEALGLKGDALRMFSYACSEVEILLEVQSDGTAKMVSAP